MNKKTLLALILIIMNSAFNGWDCFGHNGSEHTRMEQPREKESRNLEHSLDVFSKKIVAKNKVINLQYKRIGKQAMMSFDIVKPNELMFILYLLEYANGGWRISKEYHYSKTILPVTADLC